MDTCCCCCCSLHRLRHPSWALVRRSLKWSHLSHRFSHLPFFTSCLFVQQLHQWVREGGGDLVYRVVVEYIKDVEIHHRRTLGRLVQRNERDPAHSLLHLLLYTWSFSPLLYIDRRNAQTDKPTTLLELGDLSKKRREEIDDLLLSFFFHVPYSRPICHDSRTLNDRERERERLFFLYIYL